ncbi:proton channel OtopLc-like isoform X2 [Lutzomyia longipalpis]|uniref:proton channel OtopLc-like isoform X2 n=1 Tax=Lutzomyia longipalpis TaxID=7200 RepID=UPI0024844AEC|nr:proton channel OtopLc-like isoform X2 [Lutzomyia longipalpis]
MPNDGEHSGSEGRFSPAVYPNLDSAGQDNVIEMTEKATNVTQDDDDGEQERNGGIYRKHPRPISSSSNIDGSNKSPSPYAPRMWSYNRGISYQPSVRSSHSASDMDHLIPPPSTDREKSKMTRRYFATVFALCYAIFLVIFGIVVFVGDAVETQYPLGEAFGIYMLSVGFIYFFGLYIDIRLHIKKAKETVKSREKRQALFEEHLKKLQNETGPLELESTSAPVWDIEPVAPLSHKYCFQTGRHGELFYLKLGAAWFCFGLLIHSILIVSYQVIFMTAVEPDFHKCASVLTLVLEIMFPLYSIFVLFFVFKYANVIINQGRGLARFFLMHAIGTSLAFWVYTIVRETVDAIRLKYLDQENQATAEGNHTHLISIQDAIECPAPEELNSIFRNFSPYLYPFVIEFCILIAGIYYIIWANISKCPKKHSVAGHSHDPNDHHDAKHMGNGSIPSPSEMAKSPNMDSVSMSEHCAEIDHEMSFKSNIIVHADCHAASRGLFGGMVLIVLTIAVIILFFVAVTNDDYFDIGVIMNSSFELAVLILMIIIVIAAYFQTSKLDVNTHPMSMLDDVLLFIAIPAFFLETIFSMVPAIYNVSVLNICIILSQLIQILIQTPFIIDGMRRCSNAAINRRKKPGRELITFLTIANVSLWIYYTFSVKTEYTGDERYAFYGYTLWSILNHLSLPLIMFYRFHASVCLVDIWRHAYEPGGGH